MAGTSFPKDFYHTVVFPEMAGSSFVFEKISAKNPNVNKHGLSVRHSFQ